MNDSDGKPELGGNGKTQDEFEDFKTKMMERMAVWAAKGVSNDCAPTLGVIKHEHRNSDERRDSLEMGPAHARLKLYFDASKPEERDRVLDDGMMLIKDAVAMLTEAGLLKQGASK